MPRQIQYRLYVLLWNHETNKPYYQHVRDIYAKYPVPAFSKYADKHGFTRLEKDGTMWGGYLVNDHTGDSLHLVPAHMKPEDIHPLS